MLERLHLESPRVPVVANVTGEFYPMGPGALPQMLDILGRQVASPVQFVKGLHTLYEAGARVFVEVGPKKALQGFADDVLGGRGDVLALFTNHPKFGDIAAFNQALCGLYAMGLGRGAAEVSRETPARPSMQVSAGAPLADTPAPPPLPVAAPWTGDRYAQLGHLFADVLERGWQIYNGQKAPSPGQPVVITGAALGLPGTARIFDDANLGRILRGEQLIDAIPTRLRRAMLDKHIRRLVKSDNGGPVFENITSVADVIKLAGRGGAFDLEQEFGLSADRIAALDRATRLALGAGLDALRDAGIPLVMRYKTTTRGTQLPDRWMLPDAIRDDTGVIFASVFPGFDSFAGEAARYYEDHARREQLALLENLRSRAAEANGHSTLVQEIERRISELRAAIEKEPYAFDRRYLFRILSMGHSQFAEFIGARGPNTQINAACASTTQAVAVAEDWIRAGRCRRVIIVSADDITTDNLIEWFGAGFLATGAAATDEVVEDVAVPFDRRRHGMIIGMGAAALMVESAEAARERGIRPICEVLSAVTANSAFHGTRLDVEHIRKVMETLVAQAETRCGISRDEVAPRMVFVSHETYTPARGGSAAAEINALRGVFGKASDKIVIANTKGFTGHAMGAGIEDVVAVKALETGCVPPVANFKEVDPELGQLNLSKGGLYPVQYALRLGAGFGSQISMTLLRWIASADGARRSPDNLGYAYRIADQTAWSAWLSQMSGQPAADLEVVRRTLRVRDLGAPAPSAATQTVQEVPPIPVPAVTAPPPEPVPVAAPAPPAPTPAVPAADPVQERVLALVVEKTGYPRDMLALDLDLEADLGVDTVKQAEMFAAIRETYNIPRDQNLKLRDFPTLNHVIQFVRDRRPDLAAEAPVAPPAPAPAATGARAPVAAAASVAQAAADPVQERILDLVVEKTGYPRDMLALDLDLEADLGVDTVKQAEMFAAIRETYNIPRDQNLKLRDFPTLAHVIGFVYDRRPDLVAKAAAPPTPAPAPVAAGTPALASADPVRERILDLVVEKTGYPRDMLALDLDLEADLGVDTVKQAEMFAAIRDTYNIPRDQNLKLRDFPTLAHVIGFVYDRRPDLAAEVPAAPQAQAAPPIAAGAPEPVAAATADPVKERILDLVVEKTGYPRDMLALDLDLEADLGVDTVKQAEMFAAIRDTYNIPRDQDLKLRDFPTLAHVIGFVYDRRPDLALAPSAAPAPAAAAAVTPTDSGDPIKEKILEIVADKTGYPKDMLDLDLDLEADLGVDTVKQAEMFSSVRAAFDIPRDQNLKLRDFPTLAHVIQFARDRQGGAMSSPASAAPAPAPAAPARPHTASFDATNRIPRRVPVPNLRPPLAMCKVTEVTLGPGARVLIMPDAGGTAEALSGQLHAMGVEPLLLDPGIAQEALVNQINECLAAGPVTGVYWLPALDNEGSLDKMDLPAWREALRVRVKALYTTMRALYEQVVPPGTFLVAATRLGGRHGYDDAGAIAPLGGAVAGFTKTYKRERLDALVKAVDFEAERTAEEVAELLIAETLRDPAAVEIGYQGGLRWTIGLQQQAAADGQPGLTLDKQSVFLVTGAAGSIVSAITADLATASGGTFYLLDLVPEPSAQDADLERFATDKEGLKRELFARIQAAGLRATPAMVEKELAGLERAQAARSAIEAVRAAGGTAYYFRVNLTDAEAVAKVIAQVRERSGRIDVLLHAAGMERSHFLPAKDPREFDLVFDVKSDGWFNLLHAIGDMPLGATVAFSSIAGRFGNGGQADYSAANDLLCKIASSFRTARPATRAFAIDWTAWGGIGMASRGSIPKMMELAGIDMLPPEAGIPLIRRELTAGARSGEVVVAGALGILMNEWDPAGGLDPAACKNLVSRGPMVGEVAGMGLHSGLTVETTLDPAVQPFLHDHRIDGTPVLPGVMGVEAFAETALAVLPGWHVEAVEDVAFLAPFKFYRDEPRTVTVEAVFHPDGDGVVADCRLIGRRTLQNHAEPQVTTHFTGRVRLTKQQPAALTGASPGEPGASLVEAADVYRIYFHGPAYQVVERAWRDGEGMVGQMSQHLPCNHQPPELPVAMGPRWIELCFQTAGLWEMGEQSRMGLPRKIVRVSTRRIQDPIEGPLFAVVTPDPANASFDAEVVDAAGNRYVQLTGYQTVALPDPVDAEPLKALHAVVA